MCGKLYEARESYLFHGDLLAFRFTAHLFLLRPTNRQSLALLDKFLGAGAVAKFRCCTRVDRLHLCDVIICDHCDVMTTVFRLRDAGGPMSGGSTSKQRIGVASYGALGHVPPLDFQLVILGIPQSTTRKNFKRTNTENVQKQRDFAQFLRNFWPIFVIFICPQFSSGSTYSSQNAGTIANKFQLYTYFRFR